MKKQDVLNILKKVKEGPKRKFTQTVDFVVNLKGLDLKKAEESLNAYVGLHFPIGKKFSICGLVGPELLEQARKVCDQAISVDDFSKFQDKKVAKKLSRTHDYFIAQATIMPKVATSFGKVLGPAGKMPNPKAGCVVPPNASLQPLYDRLQKTIRVTTKNDPIVHVPVGKEAMKDEELVDNVMTVYDFIINHVPQGKDNVKSAYLKLTMGKSHPLMSKEEVETKGESKEKNKAPAVKEQPADAQEEPEQKGGSDE